MGKIIDYGRVIFSSEKNRIPRSGGDYFEFLKTELTECAEDRFENRVLWNPIRVLTPGKCYEGYLLTHYEMKWGDERFGGCSRPLKAVYGVESGDIKDYCQRVTEELRREQVLKEIKKGNFVKHLEGIFDLNTIKRLLVEGGE